jgi:glycosyltransferase involved in cell wall biosynthesis
MLKVCHIISGDLWAGAEVMSFYLLKGLMKYNDLELSVVVLNEGRFGEEIRRLNIPVVVVNESELSFFRVYLAIKKSLTQRPPDIIHSHRYKENILAYLVSKTKKGIKLIGTQHGMPEGYGDNEALKHRLVSKLNSFVLSKCFYNVVAVSRDIEKAFVNQYGFSEDRVKVIHNGIETPEDNPTRKEKGTFVIGSSGRLFPVKDYPFMVEVAREVLRKANNVKFTLAGDGPELKKVQTMIQRYGLGERFLVRGFVKDMGTFYRGLDVYLNTSFHEGIPISVLEAMAHGVPVIAPNVGGLREIVADGIDGYLLESRNPKDFVEKCIQLYGDETLRKQMASAAREKVTKEFSVDQMAGQYYRLYRDAIGT